MRPLPQRLLNLTRTIHVYFTVAALVILLFFAVSGFVLNHNEWFAWDEPRTSERAIALSKEPLAGPDKLMVVEQLRSQLGNVGNLSSFDADEDELRIAFKKPGQTVHAVVERESGQTAVTIESRGLLGLVADLHRGKELGEGSGRWWRWVIDAAAISLMLASVTGLILWLSLPRRRRIGWLALITGSAICLLAWWLVP